jgi:AcrR family transcriptional regulator
VARRLTPEARRAEIIERTHEMIAQQGGEGLSLREVARWCGMSAPGMLHHFDGLPDLLDAVLTARAVRERAAYAEAIDALGEDAVLRDLADATVRISAANADENRNFDRLEMLALADTTHPAYEFYRNGSDLRSLRRMALTLAEREYENPAAAVTVLGLVAEGLRLRWLRSETKPDYQADWNAVRDTVFAGFAHLRKDGPQK